MNRIPPSVLAKPDQDFAGKELVLYSDPTSISVPEEKDSVRKAIVEARARVRKQQEAERKASSHVLSATSRADAWAKSLSDPDVAADVTNAPNVYNQGPFVQAPPLTVDHSGLDAMDIDFRGGVSVDFHTFHGRELQEDDFDEEEGEAKGHCKPDECWG